ncbi:DUF3311 domain-containing protein [Glaciimonas sp. Gout2]|uniref:DUF3311 domain-containing protein n=1 Tax=unclassified Glaciimonas TaxID=2644401 RepID=UPI002B23AA96|nr:MULTISPECIES: DUF3311 domain-containing protein [unclassified Glaciimonas]MEB0014276.1 DUF3311 domain-containing protein [Glaciimonas sp. Cout2]MEB0084429.1 DUF3311 domain-containing protein [Glaciimonas sp. Gout2]
MFRFLIGIGIPYIAVVAMLPWVNTINTTVFGVPFIYFWMFMWMILTSCCLLTCWIFFDRKNIDIDD